MLNVRKLSEKDTNMTNTTKRMRVEERERKGPEKKLCKLMRRKKECALLQKRDRGKGDSILNVKL